MSVSIFSFRRAWPFVMAAAMLVMVSSGCGAGPGSVNSPFPSQALSGTASLTFIVPPTPPAAVREHWKSGPHRLFNSTGALSAAIVISGTSTYVLVNLRVGAPGCVRNAGGTLACTVNITAPADNDTFVITTFSELFGQGLVLSKTPIIQIIAPNAVTPVPLALWGIVNSVQLSFGRTPLVGAPTTVLLTVAAFDATGDRIIGADPYSTPITLIDTDTSGVTSLNSSVPGAVTPAGTFVYSPADVITFNYNGSEFVNAQVGAFDSNGNMLGPYLPFQPALNATEYAVPSGTTTTNTLGYGSITAGPDGAMWFVENTAIGRATTTGSITEYKYAGNCFNITDGPDKALWFVGSAAAGDAINQITTAGSITTKTVGSFGPVKLVAGPDGNLWSYDGPNVMKLTTAGVQTLYPIPTPSPTAGAALAPNDITVGTDGNLWLADPQGYLISSTTSGAISTYFLGPSLTINGPLRITAGSAGLLWFTTTNQLGASTTGGSLAAPLTTLNLLPGTETPIARGPDGALWFPVAASTQPNIARVSNTGQVSVFALPFASPNPTFAQPVTALAAGPDGNLWYTRGANIGKIILPRH